MIDNIDEFIASIVDMAREKMPASIYRSFEKLLEYMNQDDWIRLYILWEISLIKELGCSLEKKTLDVLVFKTRVQKIVVNV